MDPVSGTAISLTTTFRAGDPFIWSVDLGRPVGSPDICLEVLRDQGGELVQLQPPKLAKTPADRSVIVYSVTTDGLISAFGTGTFILRVYLDPSAPPIAQGRFRVLAAPVPAG